MAKYNRQTEKSTLRWFCTHCTDFHDTRRPNEDQGGQDSNMSDGWPPDRILPSRCPYSNPVCCIWSERQAQSGVQPNPRSVYSERVNCGSERCG